MRNHKHTASVVKDEVLLDGLDGTNPLGFLAALGTLSLLADANRPATVKLAWKVNDCLWVPSIQGFGHGNKGVAQAVAEQPNVCEDAESRKKAVARDVAEQLKCPFQPDVLKDQMTLANLEAHEAGKRELKAAIESVKRLGLRGNARKAAEEKTLTPIRNKLATLRSEWLAALRESVPSLELSLGKHLSASCSELRERLLVGLDAASGAERTAIDLLAAFGSDACGQGETRQMQATPFCFITGSGHQNFLDTAKQLMEKVDAERLEVALFSRVEASDETLSMRWNPQEDRRYAVMWSDPTASGNKAKTNWAINLLAYRGLQLVSSAPCLRGLRTTGWRSDPDPTWRWPIWNQGLSIDVIRSLLSHPLLVNQAPRRDRLSALGVAALFESSRVQVGNPPLHKVNFTPAYQVA
jgi:hypothetical protein